MRCKALGILAVKLEEIDSNLLRIRVAQESSCF